MRVFFWALVLISVLLMATLLVAPLVSAPAPLPRKPAKEQIPAHCVMYWGSVGYTVVFGEGGCYRATTTSSDTNPNWVGTWKLEGRTLTIIESCNPDCPHSWRTYTIVLESGLREGRINGSTAFRLEVK